METNKADTPNYSSYSGDEFSGFQRIFNGGNSRRSDPISSEDMLAGSHSDRRSLCWNQSTSCCPSFVLMCNSSLSEGGLPGSQKAAIITPVLKKSNLDQDDAKNYRPISNLTFISKVIERMVIKQLKKHLVDSDLMPPLQLAYRSRHSTEAALIKVISDIIDAADGQQVTLLGLLDMSAAFDTVDHDILLHRLEMSYGVRGRALRWLTSFLTGRTQANSYAGRTSPQCRLSCGVLQGSVLGPLLFVLYTADVIGIAMRRGIRIHVYADDTEIYVSCARLGSSTRCHTSVGLRIRNRILDKLESAETQCLENRIHLD